VIDREDCLRYDHNVLSGTLNFQPTNQPLFLLFQMYSLGGATQLWNLATSGLFYKDAELHLLAIVEASTLVLLIFPP